MKIQQGHDREKYSADKAVEWGTCQDCGDSEGYDGEVPLFRSGDLLVCAGCADKREIRAKCEHPIGYRALRDGAVWRASTGSSLAAVCTLCGADAPPMSPEAMVSNTCHDGNHKNCQGRHGPLALRHITRCACPCHDKTSEVERLVGEFHARRVCAGCGADASAHDTQPPHACAETQCEGFRWAP